MAMSLQLAAAIAGVAGPIIFISVLTVAGLMRDGYDPVTRFVSDLAIGEAGWLQTANFIAFGALLIVFAAGLRRGRSRECGAPVSKRPRACPRRTLSNGPCGPAVDRAR